MKHESTVGTLGWAGLALGVVLWDTLAKETLSCAYDRYLEKHKAIAIGAVAITGAHLCNILPEPLDPIFQLSKRALSFAEKYL